MTQVALGEIENFMVMSRKVFRRSEGNGFVRMVTSKKSTRAPCVRRTMDISLRSTQQVRQVRMGRMAKIHGPGFRIQEENRSEQNRAPSPNCITRGRASLRPKWNSSP